MAANEVRDEYRISESPSPFPFPAPCPSLLAPFPWQPQMRDIHHRPICCEPLQEVFSWKPSHQFLPHLSTCRGPHCHDTPASLLVNNELDRSRRQLAETSFPFQGLRYARAQMRGKISIHRLEVEPPAILHGDVLNTNRLCQRRQHILFLHNDQLLRRSRIDELL